MKVLVTGASGRIGRAFVETYRDEYSLRLTSHRKLIEVSAGVEVVSADITDYDSILEAMEGIDAVVHLAADPRVQSPWDSILRLNLMGTYNIFEAARRSGTKKVVFASSNHACGYSVIESELVGPDSPMRPDSLYGVSKVFGEALGRYYSDRFDLSVICLRIGWAPGLEDPSNLFRERLSAERVDESHILLDKRKRDSRDLYSTKKLIAMWISNRDMAQLIHRSLETDLKFGVFYGTSNNTPKIFDLADTEKRLGYKPQDKAEKFLR
jgi:nucleoside-diphosphate-sugar epimerase